MVRCNGDDEDKCPRRCCATYCLGLKRHHRLRCQNNPKHCLTRFPSLLFHSLPFPSLLGHKSSHPANQSSKKAMECSGDILIIQKIDESIISRLLHLGCPPLFSHANAEAPPTGFAERVLVSVGMFSLAKDWVFSTDTVLLN